PQRAADEQELGDARRGDFLQAEHLDDVDARLVQQPSVHGQMRMPGGGVDLLERDGVAAGGADAVVHQPVGRAGSDAGHARGLPDVGRRVVPQLRPAGAHECDVAGAQLDVRRPLQVVGRDAVPGLEPVDPERARHVEEYAPGDDRWDGVDAVHREPAAAARLVRVGATVQLAVDGDVAERVHVGADVPAGGD